MDLLGGLQVLGIVLLLLAVFVVWATIKIVPQGENWTVEWFGAFTRTLVPGPHLLWPVVEGIGHKINMKEQVLDIPSQDVITRDNAMVRVDGVTFFQVLSAGKAAYEVDNLENAIVALTMTNIRTVMGSMVLDELLSNRDTINAKLLGVLDAATEAWGIKVTRIEIKDIAPPRDLVDSMARQMKAEREKRALILEAEGMKEAAIRKAEGERQAAILSAEGDKQAVMLDAEGRKEAAFRDAEARERAAQAEAEATRMVSDAIAAGNVQAINYFVANNYVKALEQIAKSPNQKVLMMPVEAASIIGSLAGIAEIAGDAFGKGKPDGSGSGGGGKGNFMPSRARPTGSVPPTS
jgi:regulator of protease activity HflC (stomatin/prohibitin superfamily)